ncbi:hypothetical protein KCMC57_up52910 [Kitasatospora sp. CMC57]|uniref:SUKH-4 immunity protein of toxin-antitoxin system n=1 Tax=Kitasatospora sp. CMC57 TaxID=3231513 RepID=A0AB33KBZ6_9ACTN
MTTGDWTQAADRETAARTVRDWAATGTGRRMLLLGGARGSGRTTVLRETLGSLPGVVQVDCATQEVEAVAASLLRALGVGGPEHGRGTFRELVAKAVPVTGVVLLNGQLAGGYRDSAAPQALLAGVVRHLVGPSGPAGWVAVETEQGARVDWDAVTTAVALPPAPELPSVADDPRAQRTFDPQDLPELIGRAEFLAEVDRAELVDALPLAWPGGVPHNSVAADVYYLDLLGVRPGPEQRGEWLAALHHRLLSQGAGSRADGLAGELAAVADLPWRTVWSRWFPSGRSGSTRPVPGPVEAVRPGLLDGRPVAVSVDLDVPDEDVEAGIVPARTSYVWDRATGELFSGPHRRTAQQPDVPDVQWEDGWERLSQSRGRLRADGVALAPRFPFEVTGGVRGGEELLLAGTNGLFRIELLAPVDPDAPGWAGEPFVEPLAFEAPRELPWEVSAPTADWLAEPFTGRWQPSDDGLPEGLVDAGAREFLTGIGVPLAAGRGTLWTGHLPEEGLQEWDQEPDGDGGSRHVYRIGQWQGGDLLLDGARGEVLLEDFDGETEHAADSLSAFFTMLRLFCDPGRVIRQVNRRYAVQQLDRWLHTVDAEAAEGCWYVMLHEQHELDGSLWGDEK